jgi:hypothetical protein
MYVCMHICMYMLYVCTHVCMYVRMLVYVDVCVYVGLNECMYVCMYACMHVCIPEVFLKISKYIRALKSRPKMRITYLVLTPSCMIPSPIQDRAVQTFLDSTIASTVLYGCVIRFLTYMKN